MDAPPLVNGAWLAENLTAPDMAVLDASYFLPNQNRNALEEYRRAHVPNAGFFDIDVVADRTTDLPHMLPTPEQFASAVSRMGIDNDTHVICYDSNSFMASARLWWTFKIFGHDRVSVLDGGMERWKAEGGPLSSTPPKPSTKSFHASFRPELLRDLQQMGALSKKTDAQILDARSPGRFAGTEPEPRPGLRSGHIPNSRNLFFKSLLNEDSHRFKSTDELGALYRNAGIDVHKPVVTTCGTGVTAAILAFGFYLLGNKNAAVYDGSWTEWGGCDDTPVATGTTS
jgi:thiosulfate/3-mercaptopyruvate sulfurtransferase